MRMGIGSMLIGLGVVAAAPQISFAQNAPTQQPTAQEQAQLRQAVESLQKARYDLAMADRKFGGERAGALQQTQFAMEQLFAAVNDDRWKEEDRQLWERQRKETDQLAEERKKAGTATDVGPNQTYMRAENAIRNLQRARTLVDQVQGAGFSGHKSKALVFIDEAIKEMQKGIDKAKAGENK